VNLEKENEELKKTITQLRKRIITLENQLHQQRTLETRNYRDQYDYLPYEEEDR
jgi:cell division protein FtsB